MLATNMRFRLLEVALVGTTALTTWAYLPAEVTRPQDFLLVKEVVLCAGTIVLAGLYIALPHSDNISASCDPADAMLGGAALLVGVSAMWASNTEYATRTVATVASAVVCFFAARTLAPLRVRVLTLLAVVATALAIHAHLEAAGVIPRISQPGRAPGATMGNRNQLAHLLVMVLPGIASRICATKSIPAISLWCVAGAAISSGIVLSRARSAWLAVAGLTILLLALAVEPLTGAEGSLGLRDPAHRRS